MIFAFEVQRGFLTMITGIQFALPTALLRKSAEGRSAPSLGQTYPARCVTGVPSAVKRLRMAALI